MRGKRNGFLGDICGVTAYVLRGVVDDDDDDCVELSPLDGGFVC